MLLKNGSSKEFEDKLIYLWNLFYETYEGVSFSDSVDDLNKEFINYFGLVNVPIMKKSINQPVYKDCFKIKDIIYIIKWSLDDAENKKLFPNLGRAAFDVNICKVHPEKSTHVKSTHLLRFMINNIPKEGIHILEKLIYGKI
jgi:hypothetical protein